MTIRTRLKRLEDWAQRAAPKEDERQRSEAIARVLDKLPLEVLDRLREVRRKHSVETGKSGDPHAQVRVKDLDLPEDLRQQLRAHLGGESKPAGGGT